MISIQNALEKIIWESPYLEDGFYNWYINFSSFANYIKPRIEQITKKSISIDSIKMWLTKFSKNHQKNVAYTKFETGDFYVKKNIEIIYLEKNKTSENILKNLSFLLFNNDTFLTIISWEKDISIIYDAKIKEKISEIIPKNNIKKSLENLSIIWIYLNENFINQNWIIYNLTKKISINNINILEIISTYSEVNFLINKKDFKKSLEILVI